MDLAVLEVDLIANEGAGDAPALEALTAGLARGDDAACRGFFQAYESRIMAYIRTCLVGNPDGADDIYQEAMLRVMRHARPFADEAAFWCWLTVIVRSALADHGRKRSAWRRFLDRFVGQEPVGQDAIPDSGFERAMALLDGPPRRLLERKYDEKWSVRRLAEADGVSGKTIEHRLAKARVALARAMRKIEKEDAS